MPRRTSKRPTRSRRARRTHPTRRYRLSDDVVHLLDVCRVLMRAIQPYGTANDVCADALMRTSKSLRRKLKQRGLDPADVIRAAGVKPGRAAAKFTGVPLRVLPRVERE